MLAMTCDKCRRRFTPTPEDIESYLAESEGKKHAVVICPHCGKRNKVAPERLKHALPQPPTAAENTE